jgi:hypothetical protein
MQVGSLLDPDDSVRFFDRIFEPSHLTIAAIVAIVALEARALVGLESSDEAGQGRPAIGIVVGYPGASALVVERTVVAPIERSLAAIPGVEKTEASARDGEGRVVVSLGFLRDVSSVVPLVHESMEAIRRELPVGARAPVMTTVSTAGAPGIAVGGLRLTTPTLLILALGTLLLAGSLFNPAIRRTLRSRGWWDGVDSWLEKAIDRHHDIAAWTLDHRRTIAFVTLAALIAVPGLWRTGQTEKDRKSPPAVELELFGPDAHTLVGVALRVADEVRLVPGVRDVRAPGAAIGEEDPLATIDHLNGERVARVLATSVGRRAADVVKDIDARIRAIPLPPGYRVVLGGEMTARVEATRKFLWESVVAVALLFVLLTVSFRSALVTLAVGLAAPIALVGNGTALLVSGAGGSPVTLVAASLTMLFIVRYATRLLVLARDRPAGRISDRVALIEASRASLVAVCATTLAQLALVLAFALTSASSRAMRQLAIALTGGIAVAWFAVLFVVPSLYLLLGEMRDGAATWSMVRARSIGSFEPAD